MTKNNFIHLFVFALLQMGTLNTFAYDIEYKGFYYNLDEEKKEATLTYKEKYKATEEYTGEIDLPLEIKVGGDYYTVAHIGDYAFYNCDNITEVFIHYKIESIGKYAFQSCGNIEIVEVGMHNAYGNPKGLIIDDYAFSYCSKLEGVYMYGLVPNIRYLSKIGFRAFEGCSSLTKFRIDKQTETVGHLAFYGCNNLAMLSVQDGNPVYDSRNNCNAIIETNTNKLVIGCKSTIIPNTVTEIAYEAFKGCSGLKEISIPNSVTSIGNEAFSYSALERITHMPENLTYLGKAFSHCENLKELIIPDAVESLGYEALQGCVGLKSLYIGKSLTKSDNSNGYEVSLTSSPFSSCVNLESLIVSPENPEYDSRDNSNAIIRTSSNTLIFGCKNTTISNTVTGIGDEAFRMSQLAEITLPESVISIGKYAFWECI